MPFFEGGVFYAAFGTDSIGIQGADGGAGPGVGGEVRGGGDHPAWAAYRASSFADSAGGAGGRGYGGAGAGAGGKAEGAEQVLYGEEGGCCFINTYH